ncbi:hypothetical protein ACHHYP_06675, partial [Achlya hypogyna]
TDTPTRHPSPAPSSAIPSPAPSSKAPVTDKPSAKPTTKPKPTHKPTHAPKPSSKPSHKPTHAPKPSSKPASGTKKAWEQCGGKDYTGSTQCASGAVCVKQDEWYSQCVPKRLR